MNSPLFMKISRAHADSSCMGQNFVVQAVARSSDEDFVAFALLDSGWLMRFERWDQSWYPVSAKPSEDGQIDYFTRGSIDCKVAVQKLPSNVDDWNVPVTKMQPSVQFATGDRYECFARGVEHQAFGQSGEVILHLTSSASKEECRSSLLAQPAPASELVSVVLSDVVTVIPLDSPDVCFTFGHVRDRLCDGLVNQAQICASGARLSDPVFLPTQVVSGGAKGLKQGQHGIVSMYMSGEPPFVFDLLLDGKLLRREETTLHLLNLEERLVTWRRVFFDCFF